MDLRVSLTAPPFGATRYITWALSPSRWTGMFRVILPCVSCADAHWDGTAFGQSVADRTAWDRGSD